MPTLTHDSRSEVHQYLDNKMPLWRFVVKTADFHKWCRANHGTNLNDADTLIKLVLEYFKSKTVTQKCILKVKIISLYILLTLADKIMPMVDHRKYIDEC